MIRLAVLLGALCLAGAEFVNSIGMRMVDIGPGSYTMGYSRLPLPDNITNKQAWRQSGDFDEQPYHTVTISRPFAASVLEVTNRQYEMFDPNHRRGGPQDIPLSRGEDDAVIFVTWYDAVRFCEWLSERENTTYRLPTEAEWEYMCRGGTETYFNVGDDLPAAYQKNQTESDYPGGYGKDQLHLPRATTGATPPNAFGLCDCIGNVEEWTADWYGPYGNASQTDPTGPATGDFKVTRGGSYMTEVYYLRTANRLGTIPNDQSWLTGFRVVRAAPLPEPVTAMPEQPGKEEPPLPRSAPRKPGTLTFERYVNIPEGQNFMPFAHHNHDPALAALPNGDLLAIWYSCWSEHGRELGVSYSYKPYGATEWPEAKVFWNAPDHNDHAPALWVNESSGEILHINGLSAAATWGNLALILRRSTDFGKTWSSADLIVPQHGCAEPLGDCPGGSKQPACTTFTLQDGRIVVPMDENPSQSAIMISTDGTGREWHDPTEPQYKVLKILGIHASVLQLKDGTIYALGRDADIDGMLANSISHDLGRSWTYRAGPFQAIHGGQRTCLIRLREGALLFIGFANIPISVTASDGSRFNATGLFASHSTDEAKTWLNPRLVSDDGPGQSVETLDGQLFVMRWNNSEPRGYMACRQSVKDGAIHVISSRQHYEFDYQWLTTPPPPRPKN